MWKSFLVLSYMFAGHLRPFHDFAVSEKMKNQHLNFQSLSCKQGMLWSYFFLFSYDIFIYFALNDNLIKIRKSAETGSQTSDPQTRFRTGSLEVTEMQVWVKHFSFYVMLMINHKVLTEGVSHHGFHGARAWKKYLYEQFWD